ncbi:MAG: hypothetical protein ACP5LB_01205 [Candidatus Bathyarchaeia archaeon]|nr:MAG: hypothetical protein C0193_02590 [Candidatus Bathyarchaeota archaeon]
MKEKYAFVIMIKEKWWRKFCSRSSEGKQVHSYVGGPRAPPTNASLLIFYVSKPVGEIGGYAEFIERKVGKAEELWREHGNESVLSSAEQYFQFVKDKPLVSFIRFKNLQVAAKPIPLNNVRLLLGVKRLARGGFYIDKETAERMVTLME